LNKIFIIITLITLLTLPTIAQTYEVSRVIDGDTIELSNGEQVRYIGIDTPEFHNGIPNPYAQESYEANRKLVETNTAGSSLTFMLMAFSSIPSLLKTDMPRS